MALYTEKIGLYEKLRALFLFLSFLLQINESLWIHGQTFGSQSIKDLLALFCLAYSVGNNEMAFILFLFLKIIALYIYIQFESQPWATPFQPKVMWVETVMKQLFSKVHLNYAARSGSEYWSYLQSGPTHQKTCALLKVAEVSADPGRWEKYVCFL